MGHSIDRNSNSESFLQPQRLKPSTLTRVGKIWDSWQPQPRSHRSWKKNKIGTKPAYKITRNAGQPDIGINIQSRYIEQEQDTKCSRTMNRQRKWKIKVLTGWRQGKGTTEIGYSPWIKSVDTTTILRLADQHSSPSSE